MAIIADELREVRELFAVPRRSEIIEWDADLDDEDLIEREDMAVTVTPGGYIKRTPLTEYRSQRRGGKGTARHGDQGRGLRHPPLRRQHPHRAPRLHHRGHGLHAQDLAPAARRPQRPRQGDRQHPADPRRRLGRRHPAGRRARGGVGEPADHVRHLRRRRAAQRARRLHQRHAQRQDRDEAPRGRAADQRPHRVRGRRRHADDQGRPRDPLPGPDVRVFKGRDSTGVRGIRLGEGDEVVSMAIIRHFEATPEERAAYLKMRRPSPAPPRRRLDHEEEEVAADGFASARPATSRCPRPRTCS